MYSIKEKRMRFHISTYLKKFLIGRDGPFLENKTLKKGIVITFI